MILFSTNSPARKLVNCHEIPRFARGWSHETAHAAYGTWSVLGHRACGTRQLFAFRKTRDRDAIYRCPVTRTNERSSIACIESSGFARRRRNAIPGLLAEAREATDSR